MNDDDVVEAQIGRPPRAGADVAVRCVLDLPVVVRMPPVLPDGEPFPTRYWLTCPLAHRRIARLEADGGVARFDARLRDDPAFRDAFDRANERNARERDAALPPDVARAPRGGIGGTRDGVKCLHMHFADQMAAGNNPVGVEVAAEVLPLNCTVPCVVEAEGQVGRSPSWREPPRVVGPANRR